MAGSDDDSSSLAIPIDQLGDGEGVEDEDDDDSAGVEEGSEDDDDESRGNEADHPKPVRAFSSAIKDLEEKYGKDDDGSDNGVGLDLLDTVSSVPESAVSEFRGYAQQRDNAALGLYPTIADPKLFMMRCKSGFARTLCAQIMYKCLFRASKGDDLMIKSVFCRDHLPEFLYIEAHRQAHVLNVVSGLQGAWRNKIKLIPVSEMPSTLAKTRPAAAVKPGSWGRFRHGLHKGDLCKIMEIDDSKEAYVVHVIPRVDYEKLFDPNSTSTSEAGFRVTKLKARTRPMQRFFTDDYYKKSQLVRRFPDIMTYKENTDEGYIAVAGRRFAFEGHEIKTVRQSAVSTDKKIVNLTTDEHMRFMQGKVPSSHTDIKRLQEIREVELSVGDTVQVVRGELKNTVGIVREIFEDATGTKFKVQPTSDSALKEWIPFTKESLRKIVAVGQHVKIVAGAHRGEAGMVVSISKGNLVRLFASRSKCEYEVFMSDVIETQELSRGVPQYGQFEVFELVKLRGTGCGMITKIENGHFTVLTNLGRSVDVAYAEIQEIICGTKMSATRKGRRQTALDKFGNEIMQDDVVRVISELSLWEGKVAVVKHVYMDTVWLEAHDVRENMGFFVMTRQDVWQVGGSRKPAELGLEAYEKPKAVKHVTDLEIDEDLDIKARRKKERAATTLIGKRVRIIKGYHKGFMGRITGVHGVQCRVELHTGELNITVAIESVKEIDSEDTLATAEQVALRKKIARKAKADDEDQPARVMDIAQFSDVGTVQSTGDWVSNISDLESSMSVGSKRSRSAASARSIGSSILGASASSLGGGDRPARKRPTRRSGGSSAVTGAPSVPAPAAAVQQPVPVADDAPWWMIKDATASLENQDDKVYVVRAGEAPGTVVVNFVKSNAAAVFTVPMDRLTKVDPDGGSMVAVMNRAGFPPVAPAIGYHVGLAGDSAFVRVGNEIKTVSPNNLVEKYSSERMA